MVFQGLSGILVLLIIYGLFNLDKVERLVSYIARLFLWTGQGMQKKYIASDIQSQINSFSKDLNKHTAGAMPYPIKLKWVKEIDRATFIANGEVVVKMALHSNQDKNRVVAAMEYVSTALLPTSRIYVHDDVICAADLFVTKKMLSGGPSNSSLSYFINNHLSPACKGNADLSGLCAMFEELDDLGWFANIFLDELARLEKLHPRLPSPGVKKATKDFTSFVHNLATREPSSETSPLDFRCYPIDIHIVLVASAEKKKYGTSRYSKAVNICIDNGVGIIYLLARGQNTDLAKYVARSFENDSRIESIKTRYFPLSPSPHFSRETKGICITLIPKAQVKF